MKVVCDVAGCSWTGVAADPSVSLGQHKRWAHANLCQRPGCHRLARQHEGRGKVAIYCSKECSNKAFAARRRAEGPGWSRKGRTMFPCAEPGCQVRVWKSGSYCRDDMNRAVTQWAPRILSGLRRHLASHPDDVAASMFARGLSAALTKPKARGAALIVRGFQQDRDYQDLRRAVFPGMTPGQTFHRSEEDRYHRVVAKTYASAAASRRVPTLASLLGGRRVRQRLPDSFRSPAGFVALCAVVMQLHATGLTQVAVAQRFGFPVDRTVTGGRSWLVSQLLAVAERLSHGAATHPGFRRAQWTKATADAAEYVNSTVKIPTVNFAP